MTVRHKDRFIAGRRAAGPGPRAVLRRGRMDPAARAVPPHNTATIMPPTLWLPIGSLVVVVVACALVYVAAALAKRERWVPAITVVTAAALLIRGYAAWERALHPWDERYHALVAKHLVESPLRPTLYADPVLPYDYQDWTRNHVWLHKPPLTAWFQAASMKVFGIDELAMRLPSVLFATAGVVVTFAIGRLMFSPAAGLVAAVFQACNGFLIDLAAGRRASDHVDTLLILIVGLGVLATLAAQSRRPRLTGVVLGIACGLAYLTKSFPGLLILPIWLGVGFQLRSRTASMRTLAIAAGVALLVAAPWTIYVISAFPQEWRHETEYVSRHATEVLETHGGPPWQYVGNMAHQFGELVYVPLAFAIASVLKGTATPARRAMLIWIAIPYGVFSLMATKLPAYVMLAAPAVFLIQAEFWLALRQWRSAEKTPWRKAALLCALLLFGILPARHLLNPTGPLEARQANPQWAQDLRDLNRALHDSKAVIFNLPTPIEAMFYTPYVAYEFMPTEEQIAVVRRRGYRAYVFEPRTQHQPPAVRRID